LLQSVAAGDFFSGSSSSNPHGHSVLGEAGPDSLVPVPAPECCEMEKGRRCWRFERIQTSSRMNNDDVGVMIIIIQGHERRRVYFGRELWSEAE
jgi:hypothetical protein